MIKIPAALLVCFFLAVALAAAADPVSDDMLYDKIRLRLTSDPDVKGGALDVKVNQGVVELNGSVRTEKARTKAEKLTRKIKGVRSVVNNLKISKT